MAKKRIPQKGQQRAFSTIQDHKRRGKELIPIWRQYPKMQPISWLNDRLPDMLWAALLVTHLPREDALCVFRQIAQYIVNLPEDERFGDVTHTGLSKLPSERLNEVLSIILARDEQKQVLTSLLLLDDLPSREAWVKLLGIDRVVDDWRPLMIAVGHTLWHQSQESTDCRWLRLMCAVVESKLELQPEERKEILGYPNHGDLRKVRPTIRALESLINGGKALSEINAERLAWAVKFWDECLVKTPCYSLNVDVDKMDVAVGTTVERLGEVQNMLVEYTYKTRSTSSVDAQHDTVFGQGLYCLGLLQELLQFGYCNSISARTTLRTIAECYITLAYLAKKDDAELWQSYRVYGAGQAKLAFLKLDDSDDEPSYVDVLTLKELANEDMWQEFLNIDLGHWNNTDLRKMSIAADVKDVYDRFYGWTSTFAHGHWGAIRDTVFYTCGNPLHRLHRIPRQSPRALPDALPDACDLADKILEIVAQLYPSFPHRVTREM